MSIYFHSISQVYDKQRKRHISVVICVCCIMPYSEIFLFQNSGGGGGGGGGIVTKNFLVVEHGGDLW